MLFQGFILNLGKRSKMIIFFGKSFSTSFEANETEAEAAFGSSKKLVRALYQIISQVKLAQIRDTRCICDH